MSKTMKTLLMGIGLTLAAFVAAPSDARADYCREYTRTVTIGGRAQDAYGTACQQSDGSWMIVGEGLGNDIPDNASNVDYVIHDDRRDIVPPRVVYYDTAPRYIYNRPAPFFVWFSNSGRYYRNGNYHNYYRNNGPHYNYGRDNHNNNGHWDNNDHRGHR